MTVGVKVGVLVRRGGEVSREVREGGHIAERRDHAAHGTTKTGVVTGETILDQAVVVYAGRETERTEIRPGEVVGVMKVADIGIEGMMRAGLRGVEGRGGVRVGVRRRWKMWKEVVRRSRWLMEIRSVVWCEFRRFLNVLQVLASSLFVVQFNEVLGEFYFRSMHPSDFAQFGTE